MAYTRPTSPKTAEELAELRMQISTLATTFGDFLNDNKEQRKRDETERERLWTAIENQGKNLREAFEKLSVKGEIRWPAILVTISVLLGVGTAIATVEHFMVEERIHQLEIVDTYERKITDAKMECHEQADKWLHDLGKENHAAIRELEHASK